ncbi:MAG: HD domain-containing phosphohydrolase [Oscillospiraceae bacterium]
MAINQKIYDILLNIGIDLSAQPNMPRLLDTIVTQAMAITGCDAGTLYLHEDNLLHFTIMRNHTMNLDKDQSQEPILLPPVPISQENVCSYVVIHKKMENISDVYSSDKFDFSGPKKYDAITNYRTKSMLVIPLETNKGEVVGVLQLINAMNDVGDIVPFDPEFEHIFRSVASQAAIALINMKYKKEIKQLLQSIVEVLTAAIDERTHYNAKHTQNIARLTEEFIDFVNKEYKLGLTDLSFNDSLKEQIIMAAWLHDIGKIITPLEVMDKSTKLGAEVATLELRFDKIYYSEKVKFLLGYYTQEQWQLLEDEISQTKELALKMNVSNVSDEQIQQIQALATRISTTEKGQKISWLTPTDVENLCIKYGTLNVSERAIMEDHVVITNRLLSKIEFSDEYKDVPLFAAGHHEKINGKGYPDGLKGDKIPIPTRILGMMDVFEALTANDRPYKSSMSIETTFDILSKMAINGDIDQVLFNLLQKQYGIN